MKPVTKTQTGVGNSAPLILNTNLAYPSVGFVAQVTGSATYGIFYTLDDPNSAAFQLGTINWFATSIAAGATTTQAGNIQYPVTALQIQQTAGAGSVSLVATQGGIA